jgi:hypothetical protein
VKLQKYLGVPRLPQVFDVQVVRQTHEPMRFDGAQMENSVQNRSLQLGHHVWNAPPRPQIAFEGVFKHSLNPVRVGVFFISLHKRALVIARSLLHGRRQLGSLLWPQHIDSTVAFHSPLQHRCNVLDLTRALLVLAPGCHF